LSGDASWWADGLAFECHRCGACCRGAGNVWISDSEVASLATALEMNEDELRAAYTRRAGPRARGKREPGADTVLRQKRNRDCVFWKRGSGCSIYEHRPQQCRTYPFWRAIVHSPESWAEEGRSCAGIGSGPVREYNEIAAHAADDGIPLHRTRRRVRAGPAAAEPPAPDHQESF
jgi:Fe-S-cluster containining protein